MEVDSLSLIPQKIRLLNDTINESIFRKNFKIFSEKFLQQKIF